MDISSGYDEAYREIFIHTYARELHSLSDTIFTEHLPLVPCCSASLLHHHFLLIFISKESVSSVPHSKIDERKGVTQTTSKSLQAGRTHRIVPRCKA